MRSVADAAWSAAKVDRRSAYCTCVRAHACVDEPSTIRSAKSGCSWPGCPVIQGVVHTTVMFQRVSPLRSNRW